MRDVLIGIAIGVGLTIASAVTAKLAIRARQRRPADRPPTPARIQRRRLLIGLGAVLALALLISRLGGGGDGGGFDTHGSTVSHLTIGSEEVDAELEAAVVLPPGLDPVAEGRSLLVFLHQHGGDSETYLDSEAMFEALETLGGVAPVVAFPDGEDSYWHNRESGDWGTYVLEEVIPSIAETYGADPDQVAVGGISMGGFGALELARAEPDRFCAAGAHSPALSESFGEAPEDAFDNEEDFATHDLISAARDEPAPFRKLALWIDTGSDDSFLAATEALIAALRQAKVRVEGEVFEGDHDRAYWDEHWDEYFRFYSTELERCGR